MTLSEIAKLSGVSRPIVSAILSDKQGTVRYSQETYETVMKVVEEVNYRPNRTSLNLKSKKHNHIGVLISNYYSIPRDSMAQLLYTAQELGYIVSFNVFSKEDKELPSFIKEDVVDGLLLFEDLGKEIEDAITKYNIPNVYVNANKFNGYNAVNLDEIDAMKKAVNHFYNKGKKHPLLLLTAESTYSELRKQGYNEACNKLGLKPLVTNIKYQGETSETANDNLSRFLDNNPQIDSIIYQDMISSIHKYYSKKNKDIPTDIDLIAIHDVKGFYPRPTGLSVNYGKIGENAVKLLNEVIKGNKAENITMKYKIIDRTNS